MARRRGAFCTESRFRNQKLRAPKDPRAGMPGVERTATPRRGLRFCPPPPAPSLNTAIRAAALVSRCELDLFALEAGEEAFRNSVVVGVANSEAPTEPNRLKKGPLFV